MVAYDYVLRGKIHHHNFTAEDNAEALKNLNKAIELDPNYADAHAWKAYTLGQAWVRGFDTGLDGVIGQALAEIDKAYSIDESGPECHRMLAGVAILQNNFEKAKEHTEKGLVLSPNHNLIVVQKGELLTWMGQGDEGAKWVEKAIRLNPFHPDRYWTHLGRARFVARRYTDALEALKKNAAMDVSTYALMAASTAYLVDQVQAQSYATKVRQADPSFSVDEFMTRLHYKNDTDADHRRQGHIKSGLAV